MLRRFAVAASLVLLTACVTVAPKATMSVKDQMKTIVDPGATTLFSIGGKADPTNDPKTPPSDAEWKQAADAAAQLKAVAASMLTPERLKDAGVWKTTATQMLTLSTNALKAAQTKDGAKLSSAANDLGDNCTACHSKYKNQTG